MKKYKISKKIDKDVVLCETTNRIVSNRTTDVLLAESVPFTKTSKKVPFFKRHNYNGASKVYTISINRTVYPRARRVLKSLEPRDYDRLLLNII